VYLSEEDFVGERAVEVGSVEEGDAGVDVKGTPWFLSQEHSISLQQSHTNNTQFE
jgi:hypothetical protein